jgi:ATP-dependent RNA helicase DDX27
MICVIVRYASEELLEYPCDCRPDRTVEAGHDRPWSMRDAESFVELKIARPIIRAISDLGFTKPTPVQSRAIPPILTGRDVCATAITGSGKSIAFLIPIVHQLLSHRGRPGPKALIMTPTRELAQQLQSVCQSIAKYAAVSSALVIGGSSNEELAAALHPTPDVVVATPGRIVDQLFNSKTITADHILFFVLDEADRLLDRGFEAELTAINSKIPEKRQTLLFTATLSDEVSKLMHKILKSDAVRVSVDMFLELSPTLTQEFVKVKDEKQRLPVLVALCQNLCRAKTLVFLPTKQLAHEVSLLFNHAGIAAAELHADLPQAVRQESVVNFTQNKVRILLASDLAARGLDIPDIEYVVNYTIPTQIERYVHRVGRTARAGRPGVAISIIGAAHEKQIKRKMVKNSKGTVVPKLVVPPELLGKARAMVEAFDAQVQADIKAEEEAKLKRAQENEVRRMKVLLDVEEEIPAKTTAEKAKKRKH